jgi:hypothetical protein
MLVVKTISLIYEKISAYFFSESGNIRGIIIDSCPDISEPDAYHRYDISLVL